MLNNTLVERSGDTPDARADRVKHLPGWGKVEDQVYSGYVTVDSEAGRALFYILVEAQGGSAGNPLILWTNGGPGCASSGGGFIREHGPWFPNAFVEQNGLRRNEYAWNRAASVVYLDQPAFTGFSYSNRSSDRYAADETTGHDARLFLERFMKRFPRLRNAPLWLSGESFGGHYVPQLAQMIVDGNAKPGAQQINLKGFLLGNPSTESEIDNTGRIEYWYEHRLISTETRTEIYKECDLEEVIIGPGDLVDMRQPKSKCLDGIRRAKREFGDTDIYDVYEDVCRYDSKGGRGTGEDPSPRPCDLDPCIGDEAVRYLSMPAVQEALHANTTGLPYPYDVCGIRGLEYDRSDQLRTMLPTYQALIAKKQLRILVFSGLFDGMEPHLGTELWLAKLNMTLTTPTRPWFDPLEANVEAGQVTEYDGITYATIKGAGHMAAYTQPARTLQMMTRWVNNEPL
ncbi:hypothetical protein WJX81_005182 [Elliptochloris bilobata]|uniref:Serine carboxypeptidase n=1 Tax=Elliptochloris bilobata TaxID=381761 RepID=A0AAW1R553_9CHLO